LVVEALLFVLHRGEEGHHHVGKFATKREGFVDYEGSEPKVHDIRFV